MQFEIDPTTGCHIWTGCCDPKGYGKVTIAGRQLAAHRVAYELAHGPIPPGLSVLHHCDRPPCINAEHHFTGTATDNYDDMVAKGRRWSKLTEEDVREIRASGEMGTILAERYGVNPPTICKIRKRQLWRHLA